MKIYFAGSISAGREDAHRYKKIIHLLEQYGQVLTEHIADHTMDVHGEELPDKTIHDRDLAWLRQSDVLVGEVTIPSLGVGYEIGKASEWGKRILLLHRIGEKPLSSMLRGSDDIETAEYATSDDLSRILASFFAS